MNIVLADNDLNYHITSSTCEKYLEVKRSNQASYISAMAATSEIDKSNIYCT